MRRAVNGKSATARNIRKNIRRKTREKATDPLPAGCMRLTQQEKVLHWMHEMIAPNLDRGLGGVGEKESRRRVVVKMTLCK